MTVTGAGAVAVLGAKAILAVMLLVAGGAKVADLAGFAAALRLFAPRRVAGSAAGQRVLRRLALAVALGELALGAVSLTCPAAGWVNPVVAAAGCTFVVVSVAGYVFHRGRSCRCFGALSQRRFDRAGIARSVLIAAAAVATLAGVPAASVQLGSGDRLLLLAGACLTAFVACTAARALAASRDALPEVMS
jgi:hypothetical protein